MVRRRPEVSRVDEARRDSLLDTATRVFARRGFEAPTMEELAAACACDRRTLYRYFSTREDLFWEAAERAYGKLAHRFRGVAEVWLSGKVPALARVRSWVFAYFGFSLEDPEAFRLVMEGRQKAVAMSIEPRAGAARPVRDRLGHSGAALVELDRSVLSTLDGLGVQLESEGCCGKGTGENLLWELLGVSIALVEFHARYRGGGAGTPFGSPEGIRRMLERQITAAFGPREKRK
jgi:AcrR family transcriptional regulator